MPQHFFTKYAATEMHFEDANGLSNSYCSIAQCETEAEFSAWATDGEPETAATFDGDFYLKLKNNEGHWEVVTLAEANESINEPASKFYEAA